MKQQAIEADDTKYFPMKLLLDALAMLPALRKTKPINMTARIFMPTKAMMFVWVSVASRGLISIAPLPVTPTTVVSKSATRVNKKIDQNNAIIEDTTFRI